MRWFLATSFALLVASLVAAEPFTFSGENLGVGVEAPADLTFSLVASTNPSTILADGAIPDVSYTLQQLSWVIDESNAADFGFEWAAAQAGFIGPEPRGFRIGFDDHYVGRTLEYPDYTKRIVAFDMERLEIDLKHYSSPTSITIKWRLFGDAVIVPEPGCITALPVLGVALLAFRNRWSANLIR